MFWTTLLHSHGASVRDPANPHTQSTHIYAVWATIGPSTGLRRAHSSRHVYLLLERSTTWISWTWGEVPHGSANLEIRSMTEERPADAPAGAVWGSLVRKSGQGTSIVSEVSRGTWNGGAWGGIRAYVCVLRVHGEPFSVPGGVRRTRAWLVGGPSALLAPCVGSVTPSCVIVRCMYPVRVELLVVTG